MENEQEKASLRDIAEKTGLALTTVSYALRGIRGSKATVEAVQKAAKELGYEPSAAMSAAMRAARTRGAVSYIETLGVLLPENAFDNSDPLNPKISDATRKRLWFKGLNDAAAKSGFGLNYFCLRKMGFAKLKKILRARGICKLIVPSENLAWDRDIRDGRINPKKLIAFIQDFDCVFINNADVRMGPGNYILPDFYDMGQRSFLYAWQAGYRHFVITNLTQYLDSEKRFEAGFYFASGKAMRDIDIQHEPLSDYPTFFTTGCIQSTLDGFTSKTCLIGAISEHLYPAIMKRLEKPDPPGIIDWNAGFRYEQYPLSGFHQDEYTQSVKAVNLCLAPKSETGSPQSLKHLAHLIEADWVDGISLPSVRNPRLNLLPDEPYSSPAGRNKKSKVQKYRFVNLSPIFNTSLGINTWTWIPAVSCPPPGEWIFHEVPFRVEGQSGMTRLAVFGNTEQKNHENRWISCHKNASINIGKKASAVILLHACCMIEGSEPIATYRLHYEDESIQDIRIVPYGISDEGNTELKDAPPEVNIQDWYPSYGYINTPLARPVSLLNFHSKTALSGYVYTLRWENPYPDKVITSLEVLAEPESSGFLLLFSVTLDG